jgi:hypothetical protein
LDVAVVIIKTVAHVILGNATEQLLRVALGAILNTTSKTPHHYSWNLEKVVVQGMQSSKLNDNKS